MNLDICPLSPVMGAEVWGIDLTAPLTDAVRDRLYRAFLDHLLICIRDQSFADPGAFLEATRHFGTPKIQQLQGYRSPDHPEVGVVSSDDIDRSGDGKRIVRGTLFHTDESFIAVPPKATILYAAEVPNQGGDTRFVNMQAAYEMLDNTIKEKIDGLKAVHNYAKERNGRKVPAMSPEELAATPPVEHPIARVHDETGKKVIYVHETMTDSVKGLPPEEGDALLRHLYTHTTENPALQYRHQWRVGDFVMWDDRATLHAATADYDESERRYLYRAMLAGSPPV